MRWKTKKPRDLTTWHAWFAWYPVRQFRVWYWLEVVERQEQASGYAGSPYFIYRGVS